MMEAEEDGRAIGELMYIKSDDILIDNRKRSDYGDLVDLAADIRENGLYQPIIIRSFNPTELAEGSDHGKKFKLVIGGRRFQAMSMLLGMERLPCLVRSSMDELFHRIVELHENIKRKQMTWDEEALAMQEILQIRQEIAAQRGEKITQGEIARELQIDPGTMSRNVAAAEAIQERPELRKSSSRKAAVRAKEAADYTERRLSLVEVQDAQQRQQIMTFKKDIVEADALSWIQQQPERSVDLILTDPPYGLDYFKSGHKMVPSGTKGMGLAEYDDSAEATMQLLFEMAPQWLRVLRETGWLVVFAGQETYEYLQEIVPHCCAEHFGYREVKTDTRCKRAATGGTIACRFLSPEPKPWIWYRPNSRNVPRYPERHPQNVYETIFVCNGGKARLTANDYKNLFVVDSDYSPDRIHPNQKPIALAKILTMMCSHIGDTVIDTFGGSFALLAGAASASRIVRGCEKNGALIDPGIGLIVKHYVPSPSRSLQISKERYQEELEKQAVGIDNFEEVELEET